MASGSLERKEAERSDVAPWLDPSGSMTCIRFKGYVLRSLLFGLLDPTPKAWNSGIIVARAEFLKHLAEKTHNNHVWTENADLQNLNALNVELK